MDSGATNSHPIIDPANIERARHTLSELSADTGGLAGSDRERHLRSVQRVLALHPVEEAEGVVTHYETGKLRIIRRIAWEWGVTLIMALSLAAFSDQKPWVILLSVFLLIGVFTVPFQAIRMIRYRSEYIRVGTAIPPEGTPVRVGSNALVIGDSELAWDSLVLRAMTLRLRLSLFASLWDSPLLIERLEIETPRGLLVLDELLLRNARPILDTVAYRLAKTRWQNQR